MATYVLAENVTKEKEACKHLPDLYRYGGSNKGRYSCNEFTVEIEI